MLPLPSMHHPRRGGTDHPPLPGPGPVSGQGGADAAVSTPAVRLAEALRASGMAASGSQNCVCVRIAAGVQVVIIPGWMPGDGPSWRWCWNGRYRSHPRSDAEGAAEKIVGCLRVGRPP